MPIISRCDSFFTRLFLRRIHSYTLCPYTTLFRSAAEGDRGAAGRDRLPEHRSWSSSTLCGCCLRIVDVDRRDRKSTRLNSSHLVSSYAVFCVKKKIQNKNVR